jgi:hypothetical protein
MVEQLQHFQQAVGPAGALLIPLIAGFLGGAGLTTLVHRRTPSPAPPPAPAAPAEQETDEMRLNWEKKDNRRAPRRAGRICEVFIALPGETENPAQGLILKRSVGGLGVLVGNEYTPGMVLGVLPAEATKSTPWVEVEVKSCRKNGEDWELGVQFLKVPPYATLLLFG